MTDGKMIELSLKVGEYLGREKSCEGKVRHRSRKKAWETVLAINASSYRKHKVHAYPCFWCGGWHVGRKLKLKNLEAMARLLERKGPQP